MTNEEKQEILDLLDSYKNDETINFVTKILSNEKDEKNISYLNYIMAMIYEKKNKFEISNQYALKSISSKFPDPRAYKIYAHTCDDKLKAINHLKQGLEVFPNSSSIYQGLIEFLPVDEVDHCIKDIQNKHLEQFDLMQFCIKYKIEKQQWDILYFVEALLKNESYDKDFSLYVKFLKGIALIFDKKEKQAECIFKECIDSDLDNILQFSAHIGLIWCYAILEDFKNLNKYILLMDFTKLTDLLEGPWYPICTDFTSLYKHIEADILSHIKGNNDLRDTIKVVFSLTRLGQFSYCGIVNFNKLDYKVIEKYYKNNKEKFLILALMQMASYFKFYDKLVELEIDYYITGFDLNDYNLNYCQIDYLDENEIETIINILHKELEKRNCKINEPNFFKSFVDKLISSIWNDGKGSKEIYYLCKNFDDACLLESKKIFELAYSFNNYDIIKSKVLYEKMLKDNENNTSVINNLALIYETQGDIEKAFELLSKGKILDSENECIRNNYKRISDYIEKYKKGLNNLKKENIYIITKLSLLIEKCDDNNIFELAYKDKFKILECSNDKADEIIQKLKDSNYIEKLKTEQYEPNKYQINPLVLREVKNMVERIVANKKYEEMVNKVNLDELENIGYIELNNKLNNVADENYKIIAKRDLLECVVSYLVGSYKSMMVMVGSLIENILLDKIGQKGITTIVGSNGKNKKVIDSDLIDLINYFKTDPTLSNDVINHLIDVSRIYRNIVHPANEIKKDYVIGKINADLSWMTLSIVINKLY